MAWPDPILRTAKLWGGLLLWAGVMLGAAAARDVAAQPTPAKNPAGTSVVSNTSNTSNTSTVSIGSLPAVPYLFLESQAAGSPAAEPRLSDRFPAPAGTSRVPAPPRSFATWLRHLPLLPAGTPVHLFDGRKKPRQDVHAAVVALDVPRRDLQQCADAIMRLRAEYLLALGQPGRIAFHPDIGKPHALTYHGASRADFMRFMTRVFAEAGSASLQAELPPRTDALSPGDVLIQGGHPGHAVLVLDVAEGPGTGPGSPRRRYLLLGQSYMPAQQFHVVRNPSDATLSPWYDEAALDRPTGLATPEWLPFRRRDVHRFIDPEPSRP